MCRLITYRSPIDFGSIVKVTIRLDCLTPHKYYKGRSLLIGGHNVKISRVKVMVIGQVYLQNLLPKNNFSINQILVVFKLHIFRAKTCQDSNEDTFWVNRSEVKVIGQGCANMTLFLNECLVLIFGNTEMAIG